MEGFLGCTCAHGTMHLNEDLIFFEKEFIDEERFYPIITDFSRSTQFIVRYRLNDILKIKKDGCPCGNASVAIECIEGRSDDVLLFFDRSGAQVKLFPDVLSRRISWLCDEFDRYRIVQPALGLINMSIECAPESYEDLCNKFHEAIVSWMNEQDIDPMLVAITFEKGVDVQLAGKYRKIQRCFELNDTI
jgi:putative adenylate-forming enzyme